MKIALVSLLILIFSLPFLASFLYSTVSLCESVGCEMCGVIGHHINKWLGFSSSILALVFVAGFLLISCLFYKQETSYRPCSGCEAFNSLFLNPIKRIYAKAIIDPQIYS